MVIGGPGERKACRDEIRRVEDSARKAPVPRPRRCQRDSPDQDPGDRPQRQRIQPRAGGAACLSGGCRQLRADQTQLRRPVMKHWMALTLVPMLAATGCVKPTSEPLLEPLPPISGEGAIAPPRVSGGVGSPNPISPVLTSTAAPATLPQRITGDTTSLGQITLDFADSDIREVASQILGDILKVNYTIDPAVHGTATLHTATTMT